MGTVEEREITLLTDLQYLQTCIASRQTMRRLSDMLDCNVDEVEDKVKHLNRGDSYVTRDEIRNVQSWIETAQTSVSDAAYEAEDASSKACNAEENCNSASGYLDDAAGVVDEWMINVRKQDKLDKEKEELLARHPETIKALATGTDEVHEAEALEETTESNE